MPNHDQSEIELLEDFIKENYKSKAAFAKALDMTPQNLNHHIRQAKGTQNKFSVDFKMKLEFVGIKIFPSMRNPTNDFVSGLNEPELLYQIIKSKDETIAVLQKRIEDLEARNKAPVRKVGKTGA